MNKQDKADYELFDKLHKRADEILLKLDKPIKQYNQTLHQLIGAATFDWTLS